MSRKMLPPTHPGEILREELVARGISLNRMSRDTRIPLSRVSKLVHCERSFTPETALRLERYLGASAQFWLNLQVAYDLAVTRSDEPDRIVREVIVAA
jgi:addiction module HigA family antidote